MFSIAWHNRLVLPRGARGPKIDGEALRVKRIDCGYTQAELGVRSGVDKSHISRIEAGERSYPAPGITKRLAAALCMPMADLLADEQVGAQP